MAFALACGEHWDGVRLELLCCLVFSICPRPFPFLFYLSGAMPSAEDINIDLNSILLNLGLRPGGQNPFSEAHSYGHALSPAAKAYRSDGPVAQNCQKVRRAAKLKQDF